MPIYAYKCDACGFAKDVLQKMSDAPLEICPACSQSAFKKQLTAAGFQLKGSGWYATDFKGSGAAPAPSAAAISGTPASDAPAGTAAATPVVTKTDAAPAAAATTPPAAGG